MNVSKLLLAALPLMLCAADSEARQMFRCKGSIIESGLTATEVLAKCGEPDVRDVFAEPVRARSLNDTTYVIGSTAVETWVYRRGPGQFQARLTFDQGRLRRIEFLRLR
jgi:hypothetical protein